MSKIKPWPDASRGYDLSELTVEELVLLWTALEGDALRAEAAGLTVPPPTPCGEP